MNFKILAVVVSIVTLSGIVNASIIKFDYTGTVTSIEGHGYGYSTNDSIVGWLEFDTDDLVLSHADGIYHSNGLVDSNRLMNTLPINADMVRYFDYDDSGYDWLYVDDQEKSFCQETCTSGNYMEIVQNIHNINIGGKLEWLDLEALTKSDRAISGIDIDLSGVTNLGGVILNYKGTFVTSADRMGNRTFNRADFTLDTLKLSGPSVSIKTPTDVPEPSTLAIFALGMIGLASRRFKKQS
ncbi:PEP-CTERM sorting domain-containing protein [Colwelliaceae bacterium 6441]